MEPGNGPAPLIRKVTKMPRTKRHRGNGMDEATIVMIGKMMIWQEVHMYSRVVGTMTS